MGVQTLSVFGLGKLGATMVGCFASAEFDVIGVDVLEEAVESLRAGRAPVAEPGLQDLYDRHARHIDATQDTREAVMASQASFIIVPTPSMPDGEFFTSIARDVAETIGGVLRDKDDYHLVVLTSTVLPGATEADIQSALESRSGKRCGRDFGLCYSPEFIAIGDVIRGLLQPDFYLVGESDPRAGEMLETIYRQVGGAEARIARMNIINAELTKISVNAFVTAKISFANTLCRLCDKLPGGDAHRVAEAVGLDVRVGRAYLKPGAAFGGPCFPRDNRAFAWLAGNLDEEAHAALSTDRVNRDQISFLVSKTLSLLPPGGTIGLLGLSYKPRTNLLEESQSVDMARRFIGRGHRVVAFDPWVHRHGATEEVVGLELVESLQACIAASDLIVLSTVHDEFEDLGPEDFLVGDRTIPLLDIWGWGRDRGFEIGRDYFVPGVRPA
jgi:UDPglucose 6-dehydrogenase